MLVGNRIQYCMRATEDESYAYIACFVQSRLYIWQDRPDALLLFRLDVDKSLYACH